MLSNNAIHLPGINGLYAFVAFIVLGGGVFKMFLGISNIGNVVMGDCVAMIIGGGDGYRIGISNYHFYD